MRFYTKQHPFYCGIDLHARTMYVCILDQAGETLLHRNMPATPEALLKAIAPYREQIVLAAECLFTWYWLADLCAAHGIPLVLGHALSMKAIHGGKAKNEKIDAHKIAVLLRGGMLPQAYVSPAEMRATRDLLRRRMHLARKRGALLAHVHNTNSQYHLPAIGTKIASKANRDGVAERFADPAVQKLLARYEKKHGKGKALTILAHKLARAVYDMWQRQTAFALDTFLHGEGRGIGELNPELDSHGMPVLRHARYGVHHCVA